MVDICSECLSKRAIHCLCKKCTQNIMNNSFETGRKQGALGELERLLKEHNFNLKFWKYKNRDVNYVAFYKDEIIKTKQRIKQLKQGSVK